MTTTSTGAGATPASLVASYKRCGDIIHPLYQSVRIHVFCYLVDPIPTSTQKDREASFGQVTGNYLLAAVRSWHNASGIISPLLLRMLERAERW
jgi:hypothetical protein